jgi:Magnesium chelatase, subunit ChlI
VPDVSPTGTTSGIRRVAGLTGDREASVTTRPFRSPPRTGSDVRLFGGTRVPMLREILRGHYGMLFLGELSEFRGHVLSDFRRPLRRASSGYNLACAFALIVLAPLAGRMRVPRWARNRPRASPWRGYYAAVTLGI